MHTDILSFCPDCAVVTGGGRQHKPPLQPIPVERPFQKIGFDIMDLPRTERGNKHVVVFQDMLTKWPMIYAVPDKKTAKKSFRCSEFPKHFFLIEELTFSPTSCKTSVQSWE
jgi:hypothetical protein